MYKSVYRHIGMMSIYDCALPRYKRQTTRLAIPLYRCWKNVVIHLKSMGTLEWFFRPLVGSFTLLNYWNHPGMFFDILYFGRQNCIYVFKIHGCYHDNTIVFVYVVYQANFLSPNLA